MPVCDSGAYRRYNGNRHYSVYCHYWLFPFGQSDFIGTIAGSWHYSTGDVEEPLLYVFSHLAET